MSTETLVAETYIYTTLKSDATITGVVGNRIYPYIAPSDATYPCIIFQLQSPGRDTSSVNETRIHSNLLYTIKAVGKDTNMEDLSIVAARIDTLLQKSRNLSGTDAVFACYRENPLSYMEVNDGIQYPHLGGMYRLLVQAG